MLSLVRYKPKNLKDVMYSLLKRNSNKPLFQVLAFIIAFQVIGATLGIVSGADVGPWYDSLVKSSLTPPGWVFGVVWPILYLLLAIAAWQVFKTKTLPHRNFILWLFAGHMVLNWAWSPMFFLLNQVELAFTLLLVLIFTAAMLGFLIYGGLKRTALSLIPYVG